MNQPINQLRKTLTQRGIDGLIVSHPKNITYLTDFLNSRDSYFLCSKNKNIYFTDSRYIEEAKKNLKDISSVQKINGSFLKSLVNSVKKLRLKRIGFEERYLSFAGFRKLKDKLGKNIDLVSTSDMIENQRAIKTDSELSKMKKAVEITSRALEFIKQFIKPGVKEIEIAAELERFIRYNGASGTAFNIIVASGSNSAFPHHITGEKKIKINEPVLIDIGVDYYGYKSDLTRMFFLGKITSDFRKIYDIVLKAQQRALREIKPGTPVNKIDRAARQYISQKGYAKCFGHGLGHGIGLEVHEGPRIYPKNNQLLSEGMVFTVEPAIYLPGKFGIRIEDIAAVTKRGADILSGFINKST